MDILNSFFKTVPQNVTGYWWIRELFLIQLYFSMGYDICQEISIT
jgi:hypothetical protein